MRFYLWVYYFRLHSRKPAPCPISAFSPCRCWPHAAATPNVQNLVLLTDDDFAPWSFVAADGALQGISVDLARAACAELSATCEFKAMPFAQLLPTLRQGQGDAIISASSLMPAWPRTLP